MFQRSVFAFIFLFVGGSLLLSCQTYTRHSENWVIGFSQCVDDDAWRQAMLAEMKKELAFHPGVELIYRNADGSSQQQISDIRELQQANIDLLIVSPNEADPITPIVEEVYQAGIPVIIVDRKISSGAYSAYVGADSYEIGSIAGSYAALLLNRSGKILEVTGLPGSTPAQERHQGFTDALQSFPQIQLIDTVNGQWERDIARRKLADILSSYPNVDLIFAHNDMMALATHEVLKDHTRTQSVRLLGIDGLAGPGLGIEMVSEGILDATFLYPTGGDRAIRIAMDILNGQAYEKENILQTTVIDSSNVKVIKLQSDKILEQQQDIVRQQQAIQEQLAIYQTQRTLLYVVIGSLAVAIALGAYALYMLREKQLTNRRLQKQNNKITEQRNQIMQMAQETEEANQAKFQFFTNISHEFRTPLTLILASVEDLLDDASAATAAMKKDFHLMRKNASRLLRLVNQLLDFRRLEHNKIKVKVAKGDLVEFLREVYGAFERVARQRSMDYQFIALEPQLEAYFDASMLDKVFFNLLSNAFKFTPDGGTIRIIVEKDEATEQARIRFTDTGRGMSEEHVAHAFDRFYQGDQYRAMGSGLGLSLSRELIELHEGTVSVTSKKGEGTCFDIRLPLDAEHWPAENRIELPLAQSSNQYYIEEVSETQPTENPHAEPKISDVSILVIEDNADLRNFLVQRLSQSYQVITADNGDDGLALAYAKVPDLIVSDVMMPGQDGISVARTLKNDLRTSHIPIILLTARSTNDQQLEGFKTGVDAYIAKPFSPKILMERIDKLLWNREQLRRHYVGEVDQVAAPSTASSLDQQFIGQLSSIIQKHQADSELNVNMIAKELGLSRVQVYRKVKALLGISISDHIKILRLKKAKKLLRHPDFTIAEVAYAVGFSSPAYFSTVFKSYYDQSPSDFLRNPHSVS